MSSDRSERGREAGPSEATGLHAKSFQLRFASRREPGRSYVSAIKPLGLRELRLGRGARQGGRGGGSGGGRVAGASAAPRRGAVPQGSAGEVRGAGHLRARVRLVVGEARGRIAPAAPRGGVALAQGAPEGRGRRRRPAAAVERPGRGRTIKRIEGRRDGASPTPTSFDLTYAKKWLTVFFEIL